MSWPVTPCASAAAKRLGEHASCSSGDSCRSSATGFATTMAPVSPSASRDVRSTAATWAASSTRYSTSSPESRT